MAEKSSGTLTPGGPEPISSDSWDFDPDEDLPNDPYRGVRRANRPRRWLRLFIGVGIGLAVVVAAAATAWFAKSGGADQRQPSPAAGDHASPGAAPPDASIGTPASSLPSARPSALGRSQAAVAAETGDRTAEAAPPPFTTLVYEAEAGLPDVKMSWAQSVAVTGASGDRAVRFTDVARGEIQFRHIFVPSAGTYRFAIYYAPSDAVRVGHLAVGSGAPLTIEFTAGTECCLMTTVETLLTPGTYTASLTITAGDGDPPAIDRIVISQP